MHNIISKHISIAQEERQQVLILNTESLQC